MTKEELERIKVAYHSGLKVQIWFNGNWKNFDAREYSMYKDPFSENRQYRIVGSDYADMAEKRIAELERNVAYYAERAKHAELDGRDYVLKYKDLGKRCLQLQKDKGNLTDRVRDLEEKLANADYQLEGRDLEIKELKAQIEKMKNWCNCKNYQQCLIELAEQGKGMKPSECCRNCKKWEIEEK